MLFHAGAVIRLNELGWLRRLDRVSSVSGGSITAGVLGHSWEQLRFDSGGVAGNLDELVVQPLQSGRAAARLAPVRLGLPRRQG